MPNDMDKGSYIIFQIANEIAGRKTASWDVLSKHTGGLLGRVKWFGPWRKYSFFPAPNCVFEATCMREISQFIEDRTREHRASRMNSQTLVWGDTGKPVEAGDLKEGEQFEVELSRKVARLITGKTRRQAPSK
jgi:hypothetical protein